MKFELGPGMKCDLALLMESRMLIQAQSGGGKSRTLRRILEQTHGKVQQIVIDPEGEFSTLREKYDYVLAAATGGDTVAHPRAAALLAERLLKLQASAVVDLYELKPPQRREFVRIFCEALIDAPKSLRHPVIVAIDEAQMFAPEGGKAESAAAVADLAVRGRKRGLCLVAAVARLSEFDKATAAPLLNKLIGLTSLDLDMKRAAQDLGFDKAGMLGLRNLEGMQFWGYGPALVRAPTLVTIGPHETTHLRPGARLTAVVPPPTEKIKALLPQLADLPAEAEQKAKTEADLRKELAAARAAITRLERQAPVRIEPRVETKVERVAVPMLTEEHLKGLRAAAAEIQMTFAGVRGLVERLAEDRGALTDALTAIDRAIAQATRPVPTPVVARPVPGKRPLVSLPPRQIPPGRVGNEGGSSVSRPQQALLDALAWLETMNIRPARREQMALVARVSSASSGFEKNVSTLRTAGLIAYPAGNMVELTEAGRAVAVPPDVPPTSAQLHEALYARLSRPQATLLRVLIEAYPESLTREDLGAGAGQSPLSSGFEKNVSTLRSLGLVDYPDKGHVQALSVLFLEGVA